MTSLSSQECPHSSIGHNMEYRRLGESNSRMWNHQFTYSNTAQYKELIPSSAKQSWNINDEHLPEVNEYDKFYEWIDGSLKCIFPIDIGNKKKCLRSAWSMRNSNNHKIDILKKSCVGVHLCTSCRTYVYPAISEGARKSQTNCPLKYCDGKLLYMPCKGNKGHPVTHSWRRVGKSLFFEAKGTHDHPRPVVKVSRARKRRKDSCSQMNIEMSIQESLILASSSTCLPTAMPFPHSIPPIVTYTPITTLPRAHGFSTEASTGSGAGSFYRQQMVSSYPQDYQIEYPQFHLRNSGNIQSDTSISESNVPQRYSNSSSSNGPSSCNYNDRQTFYNSSVYPSNPDFMKYPPIEKLGMPLQPQIREYEYVHWCNH